MSAQANVVDATKDQREAIVIQPTITSGNEDGAVIAQAVMATIAGMGVVDRDMALDVRFFFWMLGFNALMHHALLGT